MQGRFFALPGNNLGNISQHSWSLNSVSSRRKSTILADSSPLSGAQEQIRDFYRALHHAWGPQNWWPAATSFEMIVGTFLTQNTAWTNVEKALQNLREANVVTIAAIRDIPLHDLERLIRPAGYFRQKSTRLKTFVSFLDDRYSGSLERMFEEPTSKLRAELLGLNGVGPETADSILLYAGNHEVFVVDAYTRRVLHRHNVLSTQADYETVRELFELALPPLTIDQSRRRKTQNAYQRVPPHAPSALSQTTRPETVQMFNEMHAWIVGIGKDYCRKSKPLCEECPLSQFLAAKAPKSLLEPL